MKNINVPSYNSLLPTERRIRSIQELYDYISSWKKEVDAVEEAIPAEASSTNQLADKAWVLAQKGTAPQNYVTVATYAELPAEGSEDTIYRVSSYDGSRSQVDETVYSEYAWYDSDYLLLNVKSQIEEVYNISAAHSGATYADLASALGVNGANVPAGIRRGGMSVKFVQSSDNKYVQFRYMPDDATTVSKFTNISNWQGVDKNPTGGSLNLVESGGVVKYINPNINISTGYYLNSVGEVVQTDVNTFGVSDFYFVSEGIEIINCRPSSAAASAYTYLCFYDFEKRFISRLYGESTSRFVHKIISSEIPAGAIYFRVCVDPQRANTAINVPVGNVTKTIQSAEQGLIVPVTIESGKYLDSVGDTVSTETADFNVTQFVTAKPGLILHDCHPSVDADYIFVCFYDVTGFCVGNLKGQDGDRLNYTLQQSDIPEGAVYFRATLYDNGYIKNRDLYITDSVLKNDLDAVYNKCSSPVGMTEKAYLTKDGKVNETNLGTFNVTDYCPAKAGIKVSELHPASSSPSDKTYICFYDEKFEFVGRLKANSTDRFTYILQDSDIPEGAVYFRATVYNYGGVDYRIPANVVNPINIIVPKELYGLFDYKNVLTLDKLTLRNIIESSSNGRCTVLWDDDDYPSLMYKIPKVSIGALAPALGELTDVHPAFIVNSVEKDCVYVSVFQTSLYEGHYVSWFGLQPLSHTTLPDLRTNISNKGDGWHLETIYERSLIALLTMNLNSPTPTGNTNSGMSHSKPWEYCQLANGSLPGTGLPNRTGIEWINGTQPAAWSHNKEQWGIQDVIGGYHKICDLMKVVNGKIYLATDNSFFKKDDDLSTFENSWVDTGAAYDYINDNIVLNSSVTTPMQTDTYIQKLYSEIGCAGAYDNLSQTIRKKLCLLLMASRLSSEDANPIFEINGRFGVNNNKALCYGVFGGAEEYINSGLGSQITAYPIDDNAVTGHNAHYNMGSRIVYIE